MCTANDDHDVCSWDMEQDWRNFLSFWTIFYSFNPNKTTKKIKIKKNTKNAERYHFIPFYTKCTKNHEHMPYCSWDMVHDRCNCYFWFWAIFYPFAPLTSKKIKVSKNGKNACRYHQFIFLQMCTKNYDQMMHSSWDIVCDRWTDGQKKWYIEEGAPPKKNRTRTIYSIIPEIHNNYQ